MAKSRPKPAPRRQSIWPIVGTWSFYGGIALCLILGMINVPFAVTALVLGTLGLIVGLLNITNRETLGFLIAGLALNSGASALVVILETVSRGAVSSSILGAILANLTMFIAPAISVVALKALYGYAQYGE